MDIQTFQVTPFFTNCFVIREGDEAIVIDPGEATPALLRALAGVKLRAIANTHGHCDHCGGNEALKRLSGAPILLHRADLMHLRAIAQQGSLFGVPVPPSPDPDRFVEEGQAIECGGIRLNVLHTPGHTPGHIALAGDGIVFAGDVLFAGSIGRTDFPGGDYHTLMETLRTRMLTLPDATVVYCGHGPETTIGEERRSNPFLAGL